ncbi:MAG: hypothetical protein PHU64_04260 [Candidatus Omnitrophica bacterium]|nr:hypothetical protein [Candidatus Omnitrophota bacterium]MDD5430402.1 hypothetical protein [Candidatus Omnitrophota bacterium]
MGKKEEKLNKEKSCLNYAFIIALAACVASFISAFSSCNSANEAVKANRVNLKPYIEFNLAKNPVSYVTPTHVLLPYQLKNIGTVPALEIKRRYVSYLIKKDGSETVIQDYPNPVIDNLLPSQNTPIHNDHISIAGFDSSEVESIKVNLISTYHGDREIDEKTYFSKIVWGLLPIKHNDKIIFIVSYINFDFGIENKQ